MPETKEMGWTSLVVHRLSLHASTAEGTGLIPGLGSSACHTMWPKKRNGMKFPMSSFQIALYQNKGLQRGCGLSSTGVIPVLDPPPEDLLDLFPTLLQYVDNILNASPTKEASDKNTVTTLNHLANKGCKVPPQKGSNITN